MIKCLIVIDILIIISLLLSIFIYLRNNKQKYLDKWHVLQNKKNKNLYILNINKLDFLTNLDNKKINNKYIEEILFLNNKLIPLYLNVNNNFSKFNYNYDYFIFCKHQIRNIILDVVDNINNDQNRISKNNIDDYLKIKNKLSEII